MKILTDVDGVLVKWIGEFDWWMNSLGYESKADAYCLEEKYDITIDEADHLCQCFNSSANIGWLPPLNDSVKYVKKLHEEHGYVFHCITALGSNPYAQELRRQNLYRLFGEGVFSDISFVGYGESKNAYLSAYHNSEYVWVEDNVKNAEDGLMHGLKTFLYNHPYNIDDIISPDIIRVNSWKDIYDHIAK